MVNGLKVCFWLSNCRGEGRLLSGGVAGVGSRLTYASAASSATAIDSLRFAISSSLSESERRFPGVGKAEAVASHQREYRTLVLAKSVSCALRANARSICSAIKGLTLE